MVVQTGVLLGRYQIEALIGRGGMGEVYRARDTTLGREVAIKALPESLATDRERLARFEREARLLGSLNHPHIATIHGLERVDGASFLVMELVSGESLAERLSRGRIPLDEALPLFRQMAEALEAAHEKGIVHRDLKPANVKVTLEGNVKVLDFGLAKPLEDDTREGEVSESPTNTYWSDAGGSDPGDGVVHEPGASSREEGRRSHGHLGSRGGDVRGVDGKEGFPARPPRTSSLPF